MANDVKKVGDYQLLMPLGSGGMGDVYFGVSPTADRVAVKLIKPHLVSGPTVRERFAAEVESLKLVYGSRVARLEDADPLGDPAWLAVEYIPGATLKQHVEANGPLALDLAAMAGAMLADGLSKVHQGGLLHRDLKPQNVILGPDGPVLIDFGLAVLTERDNFLTQTGELVGTPAYMSPERVRGERNLSSAGDIYGLAATLVFALTGHTVYPDTSGGYPLLLRIGDPDDLPDLTGVPHQLAPLIGAMLAFDLTARPSLSSARSRLLEVATAGGVSVANMRRRVAELTYEGSTEILAPSHLTDPSKEPEEGQSTGHDASTVPQRPPAPTLIDEGLGRPRADVRWLVEKVRRQYARRSTL